MQIFEGHALGTDESSAEHIGVVAADALHLTAGERQFQATTGLTKRTYAMDDGIGHGL
jgi:hypothetical protein